MAASFLELRHPTYLNFKATHFCVIDSFINVIFNKFIFLEKLESWIRDRIKILSQVW